MKINKKNKHIAPLSSQENEASDPDTELLEEAEYTDDTVGYEPFERKSQSGEEKDAEVLAASVEDGASEEQFYEEKAQDEPQDTDRTSLPYLMRLAAVLTCICAVIAGLLAAVNLLTKDVIAENQARERQQAILAVFPEGDRVEEYTTAQGETVYIVLKDNEIIGYTVNVVAGGYVGPVDMMIGMTKEGEIGGIRILSLEETPGVGTKITGASFLEQFLGMDENVVLGENVDAIAGATFSSRAVEEGINAALAISVDLDEVAAKLILSNAVQETEEETEPAADEETEFPPDEIRQETEEEIQLETTAETASEPEGRVIPTVAEPIISEEAEPVPVEIIVPGITVEETTSESETAAETAAESETAAETVAESETASETVAESETAAETVAESETAAETAGESESTSETVAESETAAETASESETAAETAGESETTAETAAEIETTGETEPETEAETEPEETEYVYIPTISVGDLARQEESI